MKLSSFGGIPPSGDTSTQSVKVGGDRLKHLCTCRQLLLAEEGAWLLLLPCLTCVLRTPRSQHPRTASREQNWHPPHPRWPRSSMSSQDHLAATSGPAVLQNRLPQPREQHGQSRSPQVATQMLPQPRCLHTATSHPGTDCPPPPLPRVKESRSFFIFGGFYFLFW